ncbi:MAG: hypothetical protein HXX08_08790 [Chloroflexi bacterium]|uniref:Uncharacterized protein n=1 Tax=Candidatus Chlorohelix allophototropha TaxID=3003348 RepID=A0A8T7M1H1_9CHLR|nr:hypothetical protein [Chloroflexota bacterium]WJW67820.1 hypothetical protein OZ401_001102 [Chloroflexota bacterium L227-S17]
MNRDKHIEDLFESRVGYIQQGKSLEPDVKITLEQEEALEDMLELVAQSRQAPSFALSMEKRQALTADLKARMQAKSSFTAIPPLPDNIRVLEPRRVANDTQPRRLNRAHGLQLVMVAASVVLAMGLLVWLLISEQPVTNLVAPYTSLPAATFETNNIEIPTSAPETAVTEEPTPIVVTTPLPTNEPTTTLPSTPSLQANTGTVQVPAKPQTTPKQATTESSAPDTNHDDEKKSDTASTPTPDTNHDDEKKSDAASTPTPDTSHDDKKKSDAASTPTPDTSHDDKKKSDAASTPTPVATATPVADQTSDAASTPTPDASHDDKKKSDATPTPTPDATRDNQEKSEKIKDSKD